MKDYDDVLYAVEKAVDQHAKLQRKGEAMLEVTRVSPRFTVRVNARYRGSRKRPHSLHGSGDTAEEAAEDLVKDLDIWAEAIK
jgi:hypothetical protein